MDERLLRLLRATHWRRGLNAATNSNDSEAGNIKILRGAWNDDSLDECEQFSPDEREYGHDDQVDAACGAFNCVTKPQPFEFTPGPRRGHFSPDSDWDDDDLPRVTAGGSRFRKIRGCW